MLSPILFEEIIKGQDLKTNQKKWFDKALISPVSIIATGDKKLVLFNRERAKNMVSMNHYAEIIIQFCKEHIAHRGESNIFPWVKYLDEEERQEFTSELLSTFEEAINTKEWSSFEELFDDWKATANVASDPDLSMALLEEEDPSAYVKIKD